MYKMGSLTEGNITVHICTVHRDGWASRIVSKKNSNFGFFGDCFGFSSSVILGGGIR